MSKSNESQQEEIIRGASGKERAYLAPIFATLLQVASNSIIRQALANGRLALNTGEAWNEMAKRFAQSPVTLLGGLPHRFTLQLLTQGLPSAINRIYSDPADVASRPKISSSLTALWMTTAGCFFEVSGLSKPIKDKAAAVGLGEIDFLKRSPVVATCIIPLVYVRNSAYAKLVFGQSDEDLAKKTAVALGGAILTNPVDTAINVAAYEAAIAKDGTPITDIFISTWKHFIKTEEGISPYQRYTQILSKLFSGTTLRMAGVGGAALIFSKQAGDIMQEGFQEFINKTNQLWDNFQNRVEEHGGVDLPKVVEVESDKVQVINIAASPSGEVKLVDKNPSPLKNDSKRNAAQPKL